MKLTPLEQRAMEAAREAMRYAYAPYSGFSVGAAVVADDGRVFSGCNVENASYGLTICAERVAMGSAVAAGLRTFVAAAVVSGETAPTPCGACRQVLAEFMDDDGVIVVAGAQDAPVRYTMGALLPHRFRKPE